MIQATQTPDLTIAPEYAAGPGIPTGPDGGEQLAQTTGVQAAAEGGPWYPVSGWNSGPRSGG